MGFTGESLSKTGYIITAANERFHCTWKVLDFYQVLWIKYKYFAFSPIKYSSTSSTDKIVLKYKYKYRYLTTTLRGATVHHIKCNKKVQETIIVAIE